MVDQQEEAPLLPTMPEHDRDIIGIRNASFTWSDRPCSGISVGESVFSRGPFTLRVDDELIFRRGKINLLVGPTGSGKTSLLMALLGEMRCRPQDSDSYVSLPRIGGVAYAAQESWVQNDTIKASTQPIHLLHDRPIDPRTRIISYSGLCSTILAMQKVSVLTNSHCNARINMCPRGLRSIVLDQCALRRDLDLFQAGDQTEVGEKGVTLRHVLHYPPTLFLILTRPRPAAARKLASH